MKFIQGRAIKKKKFIRKFHQRKERERSGQFYMTGLRLIREALRIGFSLERIIDNPDVLISDSKRETNTKRKAKKFLKCVKF